MHQSLKRRRYDPLTFATPTARTRARTSFYSAPPRGGFRIGNNNRQSNKKSVAFSLGEGIKILASILLITSAGYSYWFSSSNSSSSSSSRSVGHDKNDGGQVEVAVVGGVIQNNGSISFHRHNNSESIPSTSQQDLHQHNGSGGQGLKQLNVSSTQLIQEQILLQVLGQLLGSKGSLDDNDVDVVDAYNISRDMLSFHNMSNTLENENFTSTHEYFEFVSTVKDFLKEFAHMYGGERMARAIIKKGIQQFHSDQQGLEFTAHRIYQSRENKRPFVMGFAGYSVTVGRGNYHNQSFPFVMERILSVPMQKLGIELKVINGGMGGVPSLPYGLCLKNFFGEQHVDVVGWDFAMNEANDVTGGMECFIRHVYGYNHYHQGTEEPPMLLIKDSHMAVNRSSMIQSYVDKGVFRDPVIIHSDVVSQQFLDMREHLRPVGFQKWREFGAPLRAPGRSKHHPAKREHDFIGWLMAMHFLAALQIVAAVDLGLHRFPPFEESSTALPQPISSSTVDPAMHSIYYGKLVSKDSKSRSWEMRPVQCKTSFDPILGGPLKDIITSTNIQDSLDIMLPKSLMFYNTGWVLDVGESERKAKQQLLRYGGLGFVDSKKAYRGVHASGPIQFFLSLPSHSKIQNNNNAVEEQHSIIVCESNERKDSSSCDITKDVSFTIGGVLVQEGAQAVTDSGFTYLGRSICAHVLVPKAAVKSREGGIRLELSITNPLIRQTSQACSISHIIWI
mmetsp:Transcript_8381/g.15806  ORF Transcript_8381/g.15806 Transcript_8381/m.15806 type:complete len:732 (-) Transcript_8381:1117-3312(-)